MDRVNTCGRMDWSMRESSMTARSPEWESTHGQMEGEQFNNTLRGGDQNI